MDPDSKRLHVSVTDGTGRAVRDGGLARWLSATAPPGATGDVGVALVSDARMRALNRKYRGRTRRRTCFRLRQTGSPRILSALLSVGAPPPLALARRLRAALGAGAPSARGAHFYHCAGAPRALPLALRARGG